jgi:hypothetical protein
MRRRERLFRASSERGPDERLEDRPVETRHPFAEIAAPILRVPPVILQIRSQGSPPEGSMREGEA